MRTPGNLGIRHDSGCVIEPVTRATTSVVLVCVFSASLALGVVVFGEGGRGDQATEVRGSPVEAEIERDPDVPDLPFDDNPDPSQCGIPVQWGDNGRAWLSGVWEGEMIQPEVLLYDSHLRTSVTARVPHGTEVEIVLFQENPVLDYYYVRIAGDPAVDGWVPAPLLSFDPVT
jgi:hypothetical protein